IKKEPTKHESQCGVYQHPQCSDRNCRKGSGKQITGIVFHFTHRGLLGMFQFYPHFNIPISISPPHSHHFIFFQKLSKNASDTRLQVAHHYCNSKSLNCVESPLKTLKSTLPLIPFTFPVSLYCQKTQLRTIRGRSFFK